MGRGTEAVDADVAILGVVAAPDDRTQLKDPAVYRTVHVHVCSVSIVLRDVLSAPQPWDQQALVLPPQIFGYTDLNSMYRKNLG